VAEFQVRVKCPHGIEGWIGADGLGYFTAPSGCEHAEVRPVTKTQSASGWRIWRETRRARKALRRRPPWLSK